MSVAGSDIVIASLSVENGLLPFLTFGQIYIFQKVQFLQIKNILGNHLLGNHLTSRFSVTRSLMNCNIL